MIRERLVWMIRKRRMPEIWFFFSFLLDDGLKMSRVLVDFSAKPMSSSSFYTSFLFRRTVRLSAENSEPTPSPLPSQKPVRKAYSRSTEKQNAFFLHYAHMGFGIVWFRWFCRKSREIKLNHNIRRWTRFKYITTAPQSRAPWSLF